MKSLVGELRPPFCRADPRPAVVRLSCRLRAHSKVVQTGQVIHVSTRLFEKWRRVRVWLIELSLQRRRSRKPVASSAARLRG